jgi:hypothetical protein
MQEGTQKGSPQTPGPTVYIAGYIQIQPDGQPDRRQDICDRRCDGGYDGGYYVLQFELFNVINYIWRRHYPPTRHQAPTWRRTDLWDRWPATDGGVHLQVTPPAKFQHEPHFYIFY